MKRYIFLTAFATFFCQTSLIFADFFIPAGELEPRYEKLPPVPNTGAYTPRATTTPQQNAKRYIAVDGRFIPVVEKTPPEANLATTPSSEEVATVETPVVAETPAPTQPQPPVEEEVFHATLPPKTDPVDLSLPSYQNRYAQYLESLQIFQQTGSLPPNPELEKTLAKLDSNDYVIVYKQKLK